MNKLTEGFEIGDLKLVLEPKIHFDEFKSKMGKDSDVLVISFLINDKQAGADLIDFFERGYDFILDADISDSELRPGSYLVFVEMLRRKRAIEQVFRLLSDLSAASQINPTEWKFKYFTDEDYYPLTPGNLKLYVPLSPRAYKNIAGRVVEDIKVLSGLPVEQYKPLDGEIEKLMFNSGLPIPNSDENI